MAIDRGLWKIWFGFALLVMLAVETVVLSFRHVDEQGSFGLSQLLTILSVLAGAYAQWAFGHRNGE